MIIISLLLCEVIPALIIFCGVLVNSAANKEIGNIGYRTRRSLKNTEAWRFANTYSGNIMIKSGIFSAAVIPAAIVLLFILLKKAAAVEVSLFILLAEAVMFILLIAAVVICTEKRLGNFVEKENLNDKN